MYSFFCKLYEPVQLFCGQLKYLPIRPQESDVGSKKFSDKKKISMLARRTLGVRGRKILYECLHSRSSARRANISFFLLNFVIILLLRRTPNLTWSIISLNIITSWNNSEMKKFRLHSGCFQVVLWIWSSLIMRSAWSTSNSGSLFFLFKILHSRSLRSFIINL